MAQYLVIGTKAVGGVQPGGVVDLDPAVTNIPALLGRHVQELPAEPAPPEVPSTQVKPAKASKAKPGEGE